jgi:DNA-binding protein YbaB
VNADEIDVLEDMIQLATNNAKETAEAEMARRMKDITGGLPLPPGLSLPF